MSGSSQAIAMLKTMDQLETGRAVASPVVIVNADDWGIRTRATDRILDCIRLGTVSSTSAMVFMADSERAAELACREGVDTGLHLNLTAQFDGEGVSSELKRHQELVIGVLRGSRFAPRFFHRRIASSVEYLVKAQLEEYARLYGSMPRRADGHHHIHLCANVMRQQLLPAGILVRRNFTFRAGEKSAFNRMLRARQDRRLARRHRILDYLFNIMPLNPERLRSIVDLGRHANVEIEAHPEVDVEYEFLTAGGLQKLFPVLVARAYEMRDRAEIANRN